MAARNDITGDALKSGAATDKYREGWDRVFKKPQPKPLNEGLEPIELEPTRPPVIRPSILTEDEGNTPD